MIFWLWISETFKRTYARYICLKLRTVQALPYPASKKAQEQRKKKIERTQIKKIRRLCKHFRHKLGCWFVFCTTQWMQRHNISPGKYNKRSFTVGIRWLGGRSLHTTRSIAQIFVGVVFNARVICMICVADLIACRLNFHECCGLTPRLWSGFLVWLL